MTSLACHCGTGAWTVLPEPVICPAYRPNLPGWCHTCHHDLTCHEAARALLPAPAPACAPRVRPMTTLFAAAPPSLVPIVIPNPYKASRILVFPSFPSRAVFAFQAAKPRFRRAS